MKFLLDHDVPDALSYVLEQLGHDVTLLRKACLAILATKLSSSSPTSMVACY